MEVNSVEALAEAGRGALQALTDSGNITAQQWLERLQQQPDTAMKLSLLGELRITLIESMGTNLEARQVYTALFPGWVPN